MHPSQTESDPRPLTTDVVIPVALEEFDAELERQMTDASRDHPLPKRPDIPVASRDIPTLIVDSPSIKVRERSRTPERDIALVKVIDDIPPIENHETKYTESTITVDDSKSVKDTPLEASCIEVVDVKSTKKSLSLSKRESKKASKKETPVAPKRDSSPITSKKETSPVKRDPSPKKESTVSDKRESSPSKMETVLVAKKEHSKKDSSTAKKESPKKEIQPPKLETSLKRESSPTKIVLPGASSTKEPSPVPKNTDGWPSLKKELSPMPLSKELSPPKKESSPTRSRKDSVTSLKKESSPSRSRKDSLSSLKKESSPSRSRKDSTSSKKESSPSRSRKASLSSLKKESSPAASRKESQKDTKLSVSEKLTSKEESSIDIAESNTLWMKEKSDWSLKKSSDIKTSTKRDTTEIKVSTLEFDAVVKTEDQAWDMLLNQPEKQELSVSPQSVASDKSEESKLKSKKNRKLKKLQEDSQSKSEDDSFVEIHAIDEKIQPSCGELVSISMPLEGESFTHSSKTKKSRSPKNFDKKETETKLDDWSLDDNGSTYNVKSSKKMSDASDIDTLPELEIPVKPKERRWEKNYDTESKSDVFVVENVVKETMREKKYKSPSSYESRKSIEKESEIKDVYVIDSTNDDFPEIQITRGHKLRKKSLQMDAEDMEIDKPVKSWSSIAASKNVRKDDKLNEIKIESSFKRRDITERNVVQSFDDDEAPSTSADVSLQEELMKLCKRSDIVVAECDAPSELSFFDEHHLLLQEFPPLELDFNLDDFKLDVMKDSLLEVTNPKVTSPICKIHIDDILSSIKTSSSTFNLIDLKEVPSKKERGFSVIESDKITSQEVKVDDDVKGDDKEAEAMEKSSDDDNGSPLLSTDSDKDDKKSTGASNITTPSSKISNKSKKPRRKKK